MKTLYIALLILVALPLMADRIVPMPDVLNPETISMDNKQLYITENANVYIYSLKDFKLIRKFGKAGSGPKEFLVNAQSRLFLDSQGKNLLISSQLKVSTFSKKGDYIKENRTAGLFTGFFRPIGDQFAGTRLIIENNVMNVAVHLYSKDFKVGKQLFKQPHIFQQGRKMNPVGRFLLFTTYQDRIYVEDSEGKIHIFDGKGSKQMTLSPTYTALKLSSEHKKEILNFYKNDPQIKQFWNFFKDNLEFPSHFPNIRFANVMDDRIFIQTWRVKDKKSEFLIYGIDGNFKKKVYILLPDVAIMSRNAYAVHKNQIYQFKENIEEEQWELHILDIK